MKPLKHELDDPNLFSFEDSFFSLMHLRGWKRRVIDRTREAFNEHRNFVRNYVRPLALKMDLEAQRDPSRIAKEYLDLMVKHRRITQMIPKAMGGMGMPPYAISPITEESNAVCAGYRAMADGHGLGLVALMMTFNMKVLNKLIDEIVDGEKRGEAVLIDCAITEPMAGTDVEEVALMPYAKLVCEAKRTPDGGAVLNGRKVFISGGHIAKYHVILMPFDKRDPVNTYSCFIVPTGSKGFSLGRMEHKMGHKAAPASELIFEDCYVPPENIVLAPFFQKDSDGMFERMLEDVLGLTRTVVGAMGTGIARGAFEKALSFAKTHKIRGRTVIQQQWAQTMLTDMLANVMKARAVYLEATFALFNDGGMGAFDMPFMDTELMGKILKTKQVRNFMESDKVRDFMIKRVKERPKEATQRIQYLSSLAKVVGSDLGMRNCHLMLDMMGAVGVRHDYGAEKIFRDAKLIQIFEGTNQLNRLNQFKNFIARDFPGLEVFS